MRYSQAFVAILAACLLAACGGQQDRTAGQAEPAASQPAPQAQRTPPPPPEPAAPSPAAEPVASQPAPPRPVAQTQPPASKPVATPAARPAAPAPAPEPDPVPPAPVLASVPAGTLLTLELDQDLSSQTSLVGDVFTATVVEGITGEGRELIPAGAKVQGTVTEAEPAKRGAGNAKLSVTFDLLELQDGYRTNIVASLQEATESKKKRNAQVIGGSAAAGALLGRIVGKNTKGAVIGGIIGGGIGTAVVLGKEGEQAVMPAATPLTIRLEEPVQVPEK